MAVPDNQSPAPSRPAWSVDANADPDAPPLDAEPLPSPAGVAADAVPDWVAQTEAVHYEGTQHTVGSEPPVPGPAAHAGPTAGAHTMLMPPGDPVPGNPPEASVAPASTAPNADDWAARPAASDWQRPSGGWQRLEPEHPAPADQAGQAGHGNGDGDWQQPVSAPPYAPEQPVPASPAAFEPNGTATATRDPAAAAPDVETAPAPEGTPPAELSSAPERDAEPGAPLVADAAAVTAAGPVADPAPGAVAEPVNQPVPHADDVAADPAEAEPAPEPTDAVAEPAPEPTDAVAEPGNEPAAAEAGSTPPADPRTEPARTGPTDAADAAASPHPTSPHPTPDPTASPGPEPAAPSSAVAEAQAPPPAPEPDPSQPDGARTTAYPSAPAPRSPVTSDQPAAPWTPQAQQPPQPQHQPQPGAPAPTYPGPAAAPDPRRAPGSAAELSSSTLLRQRTDVPTHGWRKLVRKVTGGTVNPGLSRRDQEMNALISRVRTPVRGCHRIAVVSLKGGIGKTTTTACLGLTLAQFRGDRVVAMDANPDAGTLAERLTGDVEISVRDLLDNIDRLSTFTEVSAYTTLADRLQVLASDQEPEVSLEFDETRYRDVCGLLARFYNVVLTDSGTGLLHSAMAGTLAMADSLVVVSAPTVDGASRAAKTLDWLVAHGYHDLVARCVAVIQSVRPDSGGNSGTVDMTVLRNHFAARCRAVLEIPYDPHLVAGGLIQIDQLKPATRKAYLELSAAVGDGFALR